MISVKNPVENKTVTHYSLVLALCKDVAKSGVSQSENVDVASMNYVSNILSGTDAVFCLHLHCVLFSFCLD